MAYLRLICWVLVAYLVSACTTVPKPEARRQQAMALGKERGWQVMEIDTVPFRLLAIASPDITPAAELTVYLEGDGFAWMSGSQPSSDPTPLNPLALRLALAQPQGRAAYLARPCQYLAAQPACAQRYWTDARFAKEVIASLGQALDELKARSGAQRLNLVGYSGGATLALLLAARRNDLREVITVAGNLDHALWTRYHRVRPLQNSLNPADELAALTRVHQLHLVGSEDRIVPPELVQAFVATLAPGTPVGLQVIEGYDHVCCWAEHWTKIWLTLTNSVR
ncbi:alpha/beta hydrolase [Pseudomonas sp. Ma2-10]